MDCIRLFKSYVSMFNDMNNAYKQNNILPLFVPDGIYDETILISLLKLYKWAQTNVDFIIFVIYFFKVAVSRSFFFHTG